MERKKAVATAAAITMSVASGLFALGAATGGLQAGSAPAPSGGVQTASATSPATAASPATTSAPANRAAVASTSQGHELESSHATGSEGGEFDD